MIYISEQLFSHMTYFDGYQKKSNITFLHILIVLIIAIAVLIGFGIHKQNQETLQAQAAIARQKAEATAEAARLQQQEAIDLENKAREAQLDAEEHALKMAQKREQERSEFSKSYFKINDLVKKWDDSVILASSTPRINLDGPVSAMQNIKRETEQLIVPFCLERAKSSLLSSMDLRITGFIEFMREHETTSQELVNESVAFRSAFDDSMFSCKNLIM